MMTHAAVPPAGRHGAEYTDTRWQPAYPQIVHPADPVPHPPAGPAPHEPRPRYGSTYGPADYPQAPEPPPPPPAPPSYEHPGDVEVSLENRRWADLRRQVIFRCRRFNSGHMVEADQRFGSRDALGPHAVLVFFISDAPAEPHGYRLHTAYRLWLSSPEADDLPRLLGDLNDVARDNISRAASARGRWHPLGPDASMVNGGDMTLPPGSTYVGVGVSTLDSDRGRWQQLAPSLRNTPGRWTSPFDLKGQAFGLLTDGTALHLDRDPNARIGQDGVRCTHTLDPDRITYYNLHSDLTQAGDDDTRAIWRALAVLHHTLTTHLSRRPV